MVDPAKGRAKGATHGGKFLLPALPCFEWGSAVVVQQFVQGDAAACHPVCGGKLGASPPRSSTQSLDGMSTRAADIESKVAEEISRISEPALAARIRGLLVPVRCE